MARFRIPVNPAGPLRAVRKYYAIFILTVTVVIVLRGLYDLAIGQDASVITFYSLVVFPGLAALYVALWAVDAVATRSA